MEPRMACRYRRGIVEVHLVVFLTTKKSEYQRVNLGLQLRVVLKQDHEKCPPLLCPRVPRGPGNMVKEQTSGGCQVR
jgi:hypothetical protein